MSLCHIQPLSNNMHNISIYPVTFILQWIIWLHNMFMSYITYLITCFMIRYILRFTCRVMKIVHYIKCMIYSTSLPSGYLNCKNLKCTGKFKFPGSGFQTQPTHWHCLAAQPGIIQVGTLTFGIAILSQERHLLVAPVINGINWINCNKWKHHM